CRFSPDHRTMAHHVHDVTLEPENYTTPWDVTRDLPRAQSADEISTLAGTGQETGGTIMCNKRATA
ncbi:hypothetical protein PYV02_15270, partial [Leifsonia sp. H3M29-4]|uniref:hypothetical protein n=1 Tax=Salinibacterium metalliresistens TaxID=3031321 RepID=UPI0023DB4088